MKSTWLEAENKILYDPFNDNGKNGGSMKTPEEIKEKMQAVKKNMIKKKSTHLLMGELSEYVAADTVVKFFDRFLEWIDEDDGGEQ